VVANNTDAVFNINRPSHVALPSSTLLNYRAVCSVIMKYGKYKPKDIQPQRPRRESSAEYGAKKQKHDHGASIRKRNAGTGSTSQTSSGQGQGAPVEGLALAQYFRHSAMEKNDKEEEEEEEDQSPPLGERDRVEALVLHFWETARARERDDRVKQWRTTVES